MVQPGTPIDQALCYFDFFQDRRKGWIFMGIITTLCVLQTLFTLQSTLHVLWLADLMHVANPLLFPRKTNEIPKITHRDNLIPLDWNPNVTIASSILGLWHDPIDQVILLELDTKSPCSNPELRARLSGPALAILEWTDYQHNDGHEDEQSHWIQGRYDVPFEGEYYLEILVIMCQRLTFETNFTGICLEDVTRNQVTLPKTTSISVSNIQGTTSSSSSTNKSPPTVIQSTSPEMVWVAKNKMTVSSSSKLHPLETRYQPQDCRGTKEDLTERCKIATDLSRFKDYTFAFYNPRHRHQDHYPSSTSLNLLNDSEPQRVSQERHLRGLQEQPDPRPQDEEVSMFISKEEVSKMIADNAKMNSHTLCYVGDSESSLLFRITKKNKFAPSMKHHYKYNGFPSYARWPKEVTTDGVLRLIRENKCTRIVIGLGQWPLSHQIKKADSGDQSPEPYSFAKYERTMKEMMMRIQAVQKNNLTDEEASNVKIYVRSVHYNPLGDMKTSYCPAQDWRSPPVVDKYNEILQRITTELDFLYLDTTNPVIGPMWDSAQDWTHYKDQVGTAEAIYLAATIFDVY